MIFLTQDLFNEIRKFLTIHLSEENLSFSCRCKLKAILSKLESYNTSKGNADDDYDCYEEPCKSIVTPIETEFELPTKTTETLNNQHKATLQGPLYYRYNLQCWELYPFSVLINGRLLCSKTQINSDPSKNIELSVFLMGYKAIMTGKDCGMNHVFKLTHPIEETKVFALESEGEAKVWIEQINQYSVASTPSEIRIFNGWSASSEKLSDDADGEPQIVSTDECVETLNDVKVCDRILLRRQRSNGTNLSNNNAVLNPNFVISDARFTRSRSNYIVKRQNSCGAANQNNIANNTSGIAAASGGGTSIISSMRKKVESLGHKYRNRKSFAEFSTDAAPFNNKSKTLSQLYSDDNKRASICSVQSLPITKDIIYKGIAKLRVYGNRLGWIERWCQLKPKLLECYYLSPNGLKPNLDFALCLEDLTLGLSNDKKHKSALRLSCDVIKQDLLFEVQDKIVMGNWIKAFIEALGIGKSKKIRLHQNGASERVIDQNQPIVANDGLLDRPLHKISHSGSESIYDEVCPSDLRDCVPSAVLNDNATSFKQLNQRRWSMPIVPLSQPTASHPPHAPSSVRRVVHDHPLPALPSSSTDSENNSDHLPDTPAENVEYGTESVYDNSSTVGRSYNHSRTNTLKTGLSNPTYPTESNVLRSTILYADQDLENINDGDLTDRDFSKNIHNWRLKGCSLADLIAQFTSQSETQDNSSATMSSKTDSTCTAYHQYHSQDNIYSMSTAFVSINSLDRSVNYDIGNMTRSLSLDNYLGMTRPVPNKSNLRNRPRSLLVKNCPPDLILGELSLIRGDLRSLYTHRSDLQRALETTTDTESQSFCSINSEICDVTTKISSKESRLKELSNCSRKRWAVTVPINECR